MIINFLRIISLLFLIFVTLIDIPMNKNLKDPQWQFVIAFIIILILLLIDTGIGFILALAFLIIYFKIYNKYFLSNLMNGGNNNTNSGNENNGSSGKGNSKDANINNLIKLNYISPEHLLSAQNNIVDVNSYNTEIKGFEKGFNNEKVYGAQGIDIDKNNFKGYEKTDYGLL
jgi:hypothetical protein